MSLDGLSLSLVITELDEMLCGGRVEKIFQPDLYTLAFYIRIPGKTVRLVMSSDPRQPRLHVAAAGSENPDNPPAFCMLLRKHLGDGRIGSIIQNSLDRTVMVNFDVREEGGNIAVKTLVIELMGKHSNIILLYDGVILDAIRRVGPAMSRYRQVLPGKPYCLPPGQDRLNILEVSSKDFVNALKIQSGQLHKVIVSTAIGLGPVTAKEFLWRAGLPVEAKVENSSEENWITLQSAIDSVVGPIKERIVNPLVWVNQANKVIGFAAFPLGHLGEPSYQFETMSLAVDFIINLTPRAAPEKERVQKVVNNELLRLIRKKEFLIGELTEATAADELRQRADILMTYLSDLTLGQETVELPNIYSDNPTESLLRIELDPRESPLRNAQAYYVRYNKQKRAQQNLQTQLTKLGEEIAYLESVQLMLEQAITTLETREIEQELVIGGYLAKSGNKKKPQPVSPPLIIRLGKDSTITIGKNNRQNDLVTFKYAHSDDLWFHTKDIPGSHVILRSSSLTDDSTLALAARVAAYFSKARQSSNVPVDYTLRRYVKKPSGAKPGFVIYDRQTTLFVTPNEDEITTLINRK